MTKIFYLITNDIFSTHINYAYQSLFEKAAVNVKI